MGHCFCFIVFDLWSFATDKLFLLTSAMDVAFLSMHYQLSLILLYDQSCIRTTNLHLWVTHEYVSRLSFISFVHFSFLTRFYCEWSKHKCPCQVWGFFFWMKPRHFLQICFKQKKMIDGKFWRIVNFKIK